VELEEGQCLFLDKLWKKISSIINGHIQCMAVLHLSHVMYHLTYIAVLHLSHVMTGAVLSSCFPSLHLARLHVY